MTSAPDTDPVPRAAAGDQLYQILFALCPSGILLEDETGTILDVNQSLCASTGYSREELLGKHISLLVPPTHHPRIDADIARILAGETVYQEVENVRKDGSRCCMELRERRVTLPDGRRAILLTGHDISERKRAEEQRDTLIDQLRHALAEVSAVTGLLSICSGCKKIRNAQGEWERIELYIMERSHANFTHGLCPDCITKYYPDLAPLVSRR